MSDLPPYSDITTPFHTQPQPNVQGWERMGSLLGGVLMMGKGLRRGGVIGLAELAFGGFVLARGISGHCPAKSLLEKGREELGQVRTDIQRVGDDLLAMKRSAKAATKTATVTGNDSLLDPGA